MKKLTEEVFLKDVAKHQMKVLLDQGIYRHLRFSNPRTMNQWFEIVTSPNLLTINGDMHTWTFSRIEDMFEFFRSGRINPCYWAEKLMHGGNGSSGSGCRHYDGETFKEAVIDSLSDYDLPDAQQAEVLEALDCVPWDDSEYEARRSLDSLGVENFEFSELWEIDSRWKLLEAKDCAVRAVIFK